MAVITDNFTLPDFSGDAGAGGTHGLVPAPAAGDGTDKYLKADGTWSSTPEIQEDPGAGVGLIEANPPGGPTVLKNVRDGQGTRVIANTGSFQTDVHFSAPDVAFVSDALGDPTEVPVSATPAASTIVLSDVGGQIDPDWVPDFVGDSGAGGTNGAVPAPAAGDAAANKFLSADGTWDTAVVAVGDITGLGTGVATALAQNADSTSGFVTQTGGDARYIRTTYSNIQPLPVQYQTLEYQWLAMPAALTFFNGLVRYILPCDLTGASQINLKVFMSGAAGFAGSKLVLRYRTFAAGFNATPANWNILGDASTEVQCACDSAAAILESGYIDIVAAAKGSILIGVFGIGGNGAVNPIFLGVAADIKSTL